MRVNAEGTRVLLEAAMQAGCERFLYMSTAAVYAFADRAVVDESTPFLQEGPAFQLSRVRYVHVDNLIEAVLTAAYTARAVGQAYNIVDGQTTGREYTDRFCHWLGLDSLPARQEVVPWRGRLSGAKAERELGYAPRGSYEEAMSETERYLAQSGMLKR